MNAGQRSLIHVVTDRECDAEIKCDSLGIQRKRVKAFRDRKSRSRAISDALCAAGATSCIVLFDKLVTDDLFDALPCVNIHPSLLPMYPGMDAVGRAFRANERFLGATAHLIDSGVDTGPILVQRKQPMPETLATAEHLSFKQKTLLVEDMMSVLFERRNPTKEWLLERCPSDLLHWT
jgi:folate-dependent phosphoribosylglycinamide formyltransferase PurN